MDIWLFAPSNLAMRMACEQGRSYVHGSLAAHRSGPAPQLHTTHCKHATTVEGACLVWAGGPHPFRQHGLSGQARTNVLWQLVHFKVNNDPLQLCCGCRGATATAVATHLSLDPAMAKMPLERNRSGPRSWGKGRRGEGRRREGGRQRQPMGGVRSGWQQHRVLSVTHRKMWISAGWRLCCVR